MIQKIIKTALLSTLIYASSIFAQETVQESPKLEKKLYDVYFGSYDDLNDAISRIQFVQNNIDATLVNSIGYTENESADIDKNKQYQVVLNTTTLDEIANMIIDSWSKGGDCEKITDIEVETTDDSLMILYMDLPSESFIKNYFKFSTNENKNEQKKENILLQKKYQTILREQNARPENIIFAPIEIVREEIYMFPIKEKESETNSADEEEW